MSRMVLAADLKVGDITVENGRVEATETLPDGRVALDFKWLGMWADVPEAGESGAFAADDEFWVTDPAVPTYHSDALGRVAIPEDDGPVYDGAGHEFRNDGDREAWETYGGDESA